MTKFDVRPLAFRRNRSWLNSVGLGLQAAILFAPTTLYRALKMPVWAIVCGIGLTIGMTVGWIFTRIGILLAGFAGRISLKEPVQIRKGAS